MRVIILWIFYQLCSFLQLYFSYFGTEFFKESIFIEIYIYIFWVKDLILNDKKFLNKIYLKIHLKKFLLL